MFPPPFIVRTLLFAIQIFSSSSTSLISAMGGRESFKLTFFLTLDRIKYLDDHEFDSENIQLVMEKKKSDGKTLEYC